MENTWLQSTTVTLPFVRGMEMDWEGGGGGGRGGAPNRKKRPGLADRLAWPLRECKRKEESVAWAEREKCVWVGGSRDIKKLYVGSGAEGSCSSLLQHTSGR